MLVLILFFAGLFSAIEICLDKYLVEKGISKQDYFYYMCLSMIPFSVVMLIIEILSEKFIFSIHIVPITLLPFAMFLRYKKQNSIVGCLRYLEPHEQSAYLTFQIIFAFFIDAFLGIKDFSALILFSIILTLLGVFMIADTKLRIKALQKDLFIRIFTSLLLGYVTHYILLYWSNALYLLLSNFLLILLFFKKYKLSYHMDQKLMIKRVFLVQIFGFIALYLNNYLITNSVTLSSYVKPISITVLFFITLFVKKKDIKLNIKQIIALIFIILGISMIV